MEQMRLLSHKHSFCPSREGRGSGRAVPGAPTAYPPSLVLWDGDPGPTPKLGHGLSLWHKIHSMELAAEARGATACSVGFPQDYTHLKVRAKLLQNPKHEPWQRGHQFLCRKHIQCFPANLPVHRLPLGAKVAAPHRWVQLSPCSLICSQMNKNEIKNSALPQ